jgi:glycosyltransferase involved in cell wall biosynthesis
MNRLKRWLSAVRNYYTLKNSELFDPHYYLANYADVRQADIDPIHHYVKNGAQEGRNPSLDFNTIFYLQQYPDVEKSGMNPLIHFIRFGKQEYRIAKGSNERNYAKWIEEFDTFSSSEYEKMEHEVSQFQKKPKISIIMPVYNPDEHWLAEAIESVISQVYTNWELCIADDCSTRQGVRDTLESYQILDERIKVVYRHQNGHISLASNSALSIATGEYIALMDHDDKLPAHALYFVVKAINLFPQAKLFYSDEDKIDEIGQRQEPYFKPDWNEDLFYSQNLFSHLGVYASEILQKIGGFREGMEGSQDHDLVLRCLEHVISKEIVHIPKVLYHWRVHSRSMAGNTEAKPYAMLAGCRALNEHFQRMGFSGKVSITDFGYRAQYQLPANPPLVSLLIPTRDHKSITESAVRSILQKTTYPNYEIIIIDNGSVEPQTLNWFAGIQDEDSRVRVVRYDHPFNYSAINNFGVAQANGLVIGLINNDIEVISPDWLSEMTSHALRPEIGCVGAKLYYSGGTLQHGGVVLGVGGVAGHSHKHFQGSGNGYFSRLKLISNFSAVTGACLLVRKEIFDIADGLDEINLKVAFNDVDFCLKVRELGFRNLWTPYAELYHHESISRGHEDTPEKQARFQAEINYMKEKWGAKLLQDPYYNPNLTLDHEDFSLALPPRATVFDLNHKI